MADVDELKWIELQHSPREFQFAEILQEMRNATWGVSGFKEFRVDPAAGLAGLLEFSDAIGRVYTGVRASSDDPTVYIRLLDPVAFDRGEG